MVDKSLLTMGERLVIRWMRYKSSFPALDYLNSLGAERDRVEARLLAYATQMATHGKLPSDSHGHWLGGAFSDIYEFKPHGHRFMAFLDGKQMYITNGAPKRKPKAQEGDYTVALNMRQNFFSERTRKRRDGR